MRSLVPCTCLLFIAGGTYGADSTHNEIVLNALKYQAWSGQSIDIPFVSELQFQREIGSFKKLNGDSFLSAAPRVTSIYDPTSASHELTPFYSAKNPRIRFILNYFIPRTALLLSAGYDSGSDAEKITLSSTKFFGVSTYFRLGSQSAVYLVFGTWGPQSATERPCIDAYDREYWCANLTAWSDHTPLDSFQLNFINLRYELRF